MNVVYAENDTIFLTKLMRPIASKAVPGFIQKRPAIINGGDFDKYEIKFCFALKDDNADLIFNQKEKDVLLIGNYQSDSIYIHPSVSWSRVKKNNFIECNGRFFKVIFIQPQGEFVVISQVFKFPKEDDNTSVISFVDKLPNDSFTLLDGKEAQFSNYLEQKKLIYVEFWGTWCHGCIQVLPDLIELNKKYSKKVTIISMNYEDSITDAINFAKKNKMIWVQGISTEKINRKFLLNGFPYGVLFDETGKVIKWDTTPREVFNYFNFNQNND